MLQKMFGLFMIMHGGMSFMAGLIIGIIMPSFIPQTIPNTLWFVIVGIKVCIDVYLGCWLLTVKKV